MKVVENMAVPATVLHVTPMVAFRSDAHVGTNSDTPLVPDCSHWEFASFLPSLASGISPYPSLWCLLASCPSAFQFMLGEGVLLVSVGGRSRAAFL
ncbi:Protein trichome berefringence-like 7 [Vitis vinifera]|uniref:Protein trichome berefringence-like 7 n=1 Tax=Vitis vinifera TaxID=29760 RepID=A0A438HKJ6_VITVI|nr:Protein trichome berefringence-like 7 [Vitis vinifera]